MRRLLQDLRDARSVLERVEYGMLTDEMIAGVSLAFSDGRCLRLYVDEDTDQIVLRERQDERDAVVDVTGTRPWLAVVGKPLFSSWLLENQDGYRDGIQLEFGESVDDELTAIQLQGAGSTIRLGILSVVEFNCRVFASPSGTITKPR